MLPLSAVEALMRRIFLLKQKLELKALSNMLNLSIAIGVSHSLEARKIGLEVGV